jgi:sulfofructosephosphate aldolase
MPVPMSDGLRPLARPSGAFAMLALDQRETLRTMLETRSAGSVPDAALAEFKVDAARALASEASAVLLDVAFGLGPVREAGAIPPGTGLIVAADGLTQTPGGPVEWTTTDEAVLADDAIAAVADAYKLLVIWRPGREEAAREAVVRTFVDGCRRRGKPGIVEGIVRSVSGAPLAPVEHAALVVEAAVELAELGADLYKAEVPTLGASSDEEITEASRELTARLPCPWVVLSNGVTTERFPDAAVAAARGGASGFPAGRAIWLSSIAAPDIRHDLETVARERLRTLAARIDDVARPWWDAPSSATARTTGS